MSKGVLFILFKRMTKIALFQNCNIDKDWWLHFMPEIIPCILCMANKAYISVWFLLFKEATRKA